MVSWMLGSDASMRCSHTWVIRYVAILGFGLALYTLFTHRLVDNDPKQIEYH